ncbi:MAG: mannitol dehydrogenase family protein [Roseiarcus sp.]|jgi:tagaturonate reductase
MAFPIIQFGTSRFLQAHVDLFVSEALTKGEAMGRIVAVQTTLNPESRKRIAAFAEDRPYVVEIKGIAEGVVVDERVEVSSVGGGVDANEQWDEVERLFNAARCMVSNTADRGYETDAADRPDGRPPRSFPAKLAKLLIARHRAGGPPITLFPCELTPANGQTLRAAVLNVLDGWNAPAPARRWIGDDCVWVNSLVDRVVSQPLEPLGAVAEPYALWAIEDRPGLEPPCRHADIVVTNDLKPYERLKLFILNLGHTYLAELWRRGNGAPAMTVREAMADEAMRAELDDLYEKEVVPVFAGIGMEKEARAYRDTVIDRFRNPFLDHRLAEIFANHEPKKERRFGGLIALAEANDIRVSQPRLRAALASNEGAVSTPAG